MIAPAKGAQLCRVWPAHFQAALPNVPVPLVNPDPDIQVALQSMIESIYRRYRYEQSIDYTKELTPPLGKKEKAWFASEVSAGQANDTGRRGNSRKKKPKTN